jgi:hypothetical protein
VVSPPSQPCPLGIFIECILEAALLV